MLTLLLALVVAVAPVQPEVSADAIRPHCRTKSTIRVFMIHHKGSRVPARVVTLSLRAYAEGVMASGAWPAYKPPESLKVGAATIIARARWFICHPQRGYVWHGKRYDIHNGSVRKALRGTGADSGQLYRPPFRVHSKIKRAVDAVLDYRLVKAGRMAKPQWTGESGRPIGNRVFEDSATRLARRGWSWDRILHHFIWRLRIVKLGA